MSWLDVCHGFLELGSWPVRYEAMIGIRMAVTLGLIIAAHALIRSYRPSRLPTVSHLRGVAYTVLMVCLLYGSLLSGQSKAPSPSYQFGINFALLLWVTADIFSIGNRRWLNRVRRSAKEKK